jgi:hypothetical protein
MVWLEGALFFYQLFAACRNIGGMSLADPHTHLSIPTLISAHTSSKLKFRAPPKQSNTAIIDHLQAKTVVKGISQTASKDVSL